MKIIEVLPPTNPNSTNHVYIGEDGNAYGTFNNGTDPIEMDGKILYQKIINYDGVGYARVKIRRQDKYLHRLVATLFVPNPDNKPVVDHVNGDKSDNRAENLEWVTFAENSQRAVNRAGKSRTVLWCEACDKAAISTWCTEEFDDRRIQWRKHRQVVRRPAILPL